MIDRMDNCGRTLALEDIERLEHELGVCLPNDYKSFILRYNGGIPHPAAFPIQGMAGNPYAVVHEFFGIDQRAESNNLKWNYAIFSRDTPRHLFPIACTPSGDVICLSLFGKDSGSVLLWDYYNAPRDPSSYEGVYLIARSFSDFLGGVFESPESPK